MRVFANSLIPDFAINRIVTAFKKYSPSSIEFVDKEEEAELSIIYIFGQRRKINWRIERLKKEGKKYAVVQLCLRSTTHPGISDWSDIWSGSELVWSYYDFPDPNLYHAPLGVESTVFSETPSERIYISNVGQHRDECVNETLEAAKLTSNKVFVSGNLTDEELALGYSQCQYVVGLRRVEGFEMPVIEGLMCGARPIVFDKPHYRQWFGNLVEYIDEGTHNEVVEQLEMKFSQPPRPVLDEEKDFVKFNFDWERIIKGFWERILWQ